MKCLEDDKTAEVQLQEVGILSGCKDNPPQMEHDPPVEGESNKYLPLSNINTLY